jgi:hypothetical protein
LGRPFCRGGTRPDSNEKALRILIARLKMSPGDEFVVDEATSGSIILNRRDLRAILEGEGN